MFKGKGNVALGEKLQHNRRIDIDFQQNAWMVYWKTIREWRYRTPVQGIADRKNENALFAAMFHFK